MPSSRIASRLGARHESGTTYAQHIGFGSLLKGLHCSMLKVWQGTWYVTYSTAVDYLATNTTSKEY